MISIIISSHNELNFKQIEANIDQTLGEDFEIIKIENQNQMGICAAYNLGATKAIYEYVCFCHEDILFHTQNWGKLLVDLFDKDKNIGLIGLAGSSYKPLIPSGWSFPASPLISMNVIQNDPNLISLPAHQQKINKNHPPTPAATIDGCFMATKTSLWKNNQFDEKTFDNYHCYDLDFSLSIGKTHQVVVANNILISHLSSGGFTEKWLAETYKLHKKWKNDLPRATENLSRKEKNNEELGAYQFLMLKTHQLKYRRLSLFNVLFKVKTLKALGWRNWAISLLKTIYYLPKNII
ncbi:glycosyltransferase [Pedobacter namyangjuensis]|uniref:glycosyltransferase n=1 Tax=Pedobacter namyangjuensis TaxID=600626 RepID=UPI000DE3F771|nr:glycosyltransferase [Pedobacter namyangjuensis]